MAERRMFAKTIVLSDAFLDMPCSTRCLYFTLGMFGDDDGFVNSPRAIMRQCGASDDDMKLLIAKKFVLLFDSGVIVIKHWRLNNYLRSDRYSETKYKEEKACLCTDENGSYRISDGNNDGIPSGIPSGDTGKVSIGKSKDSITPPISPSCGVTELVGSPKLDEAVNTWISYKDEKNQRLGESGRNTLIQQINEKVDEFGEDSVINCINVTMSSGYSRIAWDLLLGRNQPVKKQKVYTQAEKDEFNATILEFMKGETE